MRFEKPVSVNHIRDEVWPNDLKPIFCIAGNIGNHYVLRHYTHCELRSMSGSVFIRECCRPLA